MKTKTIKIDKISIRFSDSGKGKPVVLLHGYLESLEIWSSFSKRLSDYYRVISLGIPGHGMSGIAGNIHSMDLMAEFVKKLLDSLSVEKFFLIGHSMGGYIALAFAARYPQYLAGYSLFHSTPFADTGEKKSDREREIDLVKQGKKELIVSTNIPRAFSDVNIGKLSKEVKFAKKLARNTPDYGIIPLLRGMMERPERTSVINESGIPLLWILGKHDNYINYNQVIPRINPGPEGEIFVLENSGHMGFIEEPEKLLIKVTEFINKIPF